MVGTGDFSRLIIWKWHFNEIKGSLLSSLIMVSHVVLGGTQVGIGSSWFEQSHLVTHHCTMSATQVAFLFPRHVWPALAGASLLSPNLQTSILQISLLIPYLHPSVRQIHEIPGCQPTTLGYKGVYIRGYKWVFIKGL